MRSGQMRHSVVFQQQATTQDTAGQQTNTWTDIATVRCAVRHMSGREYNQSGGEHSEVTTEIRTWWHPLLDTLKPADRAVIGSRTYDIKHINNVMEKDRELVLQCEYDPAA